MSRALCSRWPKYCSLGFSISPSDEYSGLISFRTDWFDLLAVQGTLKSILQYHSSKASILRCLALFMVQLSSKMENWVVPFWGSVARRQARGAREDQGRSPWEGPTLQRPRGPGGSASEGGWGSQGRGTCLCKGLGEISERHVLA